LISGSFTQLVWKGTTHIGSAIARNDDLIVVIVLYFPPGNIQNTFMANVEL